MVLKGMTAEGIYWAFSTLYASNWHPVTWLSHMLDHEIFGSNPGAQHLVNVLFHMLNSVLLFSVLRKATGSIWRSFAVGILFAIHPIHVESVAWLAERKDVLSLFFGLLTIWSYVRFTEKPTVTAYIPVVIFFALGLMAKPVLVTLPFILLLLDYWPLNRYVKLTPATGTAIPIKTTRWTQLLLEKMPLLVLSLASCIVTLYAQGRWGSVASMETLAPAVRVTNAFASYLVYLQKLFLPVDLAVIYPYPEFFNHGLVVAAVVALTTITFLACWKISRFPFVFVGWFWFLGSMIPMIGLIQVGYQSMADRYTYLPFIGLYILLAWLCAEMFKRHKKVLIALCLVWAGLLMSLTFQQVGYWKDNSSLFEHAIKVTDRNYVAYQYLAQVKMDNGELDAALDYLSKALAINPDDPKAHATLGNLYAKRGELILAIKSFKYALKLNPKISEVYNNLGVTYYRLGDIAKAIRYYQTALELNPDYSKAARNLEVALRDFRGDN
jgi:tetratricopeptide (TPR) repeat protein